MKYIDADKLIAEIRELRSNSCISESDEYYEYAKSEIIDIITSLQQEQPEGIEGVVHHCANVHYLATNTEQLNSRLKEFEEGAEVRVFIYARNEDEK